MPGLAAFPKCFLDDLCVHGTMSVEEWIQVGATLGVDGLEFYAGFVRDDAAWLAGTKTLLEDHGLAMPMLCCSPDLTADDLEGELAKERTWIRATRALGGGYCRVLSGQRRPDLDIDRGVDRVVGAIESLLPFAADHGIVLIMENHYKDNYWSYPEFAQASDVFCRIVERIDHPNFGVNYDPSNAFLAGEDPLDVLEKVKHRVVTMHASDRTLLFGTIEDLRREENDAVGYAKRLSHGEIGKGLNDFDAIFATLKACGRTPKWISIEDGVNGLDELRRSAAFLRGKMATHFGTAARS